MLGTTRSYIIGFAGCLILTLAAYFVATGHFFSKMGSDLTVAALAVIQCGLFLALFFELGHEEKPDWNMTVFLFMIGIAALIIAGSVWIMYHLNYNLMMMHP
jgi:cytochrome o ubiquinol oxidase subunit IV